jgi:hypothetical protein
MKRAAKRFAADIPLTLVSSTGAGDPASSDKVRQS